MSKQKKRKPSITQSIVIEANKIIDRKHTHKVTNKYYKANVKRFIKFAREQYDCKSLAACKNHLQDYCDWLIKSEDFTASTIHGYMAACVTLYDDVTLGDIRNRPIRHTAEYIRGRKELYSPPVSRDLNDPKWEPIVSMQRCICARRRELKNIRGKDLIEIDGQYYVYIRKSKGGRDQRQIIMPEDVEYVKSYFKGKAPDEKIFSDEMFNNQLNFHKLRAEGAKKYYFYILDKIKNEPGFRERLIEDLTKKWNTYNLDPKTQKPKLLDPKIFEGNHVLRGRCRKLAEEKGIDARINRLAAAACSFDRLAHWRISVTIYSYLLA